MIKEFRKYEELFRELDEHITGQAHIYVIGGAVMLYHELKKATKDIDIVVRTLAEFKAVEQALKKKTKFTTQVVPLQYKKFDLNQIYVRKEFRIDLFQKTVCKGFFLSESMRKRAKQILQLKNLKVSLCSTTDIFMFKTLTERPGDIDDCRQLAREEIDWKAMLTEIQEQIKAAKRPVWITYIGERLDLMQEEGLQIPIMAEIDRLREQFFEDLEKKLGKQ